MDKKDKKICRIGDDRIVEYEKRSRSGSIQVFYTGNDERDFARYRAEKGPSTLNVKIHDKPDTIRINPPERHYDSQLIDGEWWWVNGCPECNGGEPVYANVKCETHDICVTCHTERKDIKGIVWGHKRGFRCNPCQEAIMAAARREALENVAAEEYNESDYRYNDNVVCPHCASSYDPDCNVPDGEEICEICGGTYSVEPEYTITYSTEVVGKRLTV